MRQQALFVDVPTPPQARGESMDWTVTVAPGDFEDVFDDPLLSTSFGNDETSDSGDFPDFEASRAVLGQVRRY